MIGAVNGTEPTASMTDAGNGTSVDSGLARDITAYLETSDPEILANPYPLYRRLREAGRVISHPSVVLVTRYDDILAVLRDPGRFSSRRNVGSRNDAATSRMSPENAVKAQEVLDFVDGWMLAQDDPAHSRLRRIVQRAFTPARVRAMRDDIEEVALDLLTRAEPKGRIDVIGEFAYRLPIIIIGRMLGLDESEYPVLREWSRAISVFQGSEFAEWTVEPARHAVDGFREYVASRRADAEALTEPRNLLDALFLARGDNGDRLTEDEVVSNFGLLVFAGHETTTNLIGNGLLALLRHPDQMDKLRSGVVSVETAVEELLRYDSSVQAAHRLVTEDVELAGVPIKRGTNLRLCLGSAHHDPAHFERPEELDLTRFEGGKIGHLGFGLGPHFCLGSVLARLEASLALQKLIDRYPLMSLATEEINWTRSSTNRGMEELWVDLGTGRTG